MEFGILGPVEAWRDGREVPLGGPKPRALVAMLLLADNDVVSRDRLIDGIWGGRPPSSAAHTLDDHMSRLRKALGPDRIQTRAPGYVLHVEPGELDLERLSGCWRRGGVPGGTVTPVSPLGRSAKRTAYGAGGRLPTSSSSHSRGWTSSGSRNSGLSRSRSASRLRWRSVAMAN
jgi:hypothetical protein